MDQRRLTITLLDYERDALYRLARAERRNTRQHAALLVQYELEWRGLLPDDRQPVTAVKGVRHTPAKAPQFTIEARPVKLPQPERARRLAQVCDLLLQKAQERRQAGNGEGGRRHEQ